MNLRDAFAVIAPQIGTTADQLMTYTDEDTVGGWHPDPTHAKWGCGSVFEGEGQFVYALVRALRPANVLEIGVGNGCVTTHILAALTLNGNGKLTSVDPHPYNTENVPAAWRKQWKFVPEDGVAWLADHQKSYRADVVFEDAMHSYEMTHDIISQLEALRPRLVMSHDSEHGVEGERVRQAYADVYGAFVSVLIEPSDCGLCWKVLQ